MQESHKNGCLFRIYIKWDFFLNFVHILLTIWEWSLRNHSSKNKAKINSFCHYRYQASLPVYVQFHHEQHGIGQLPRGRGERKVTKTEVEKGNKD